MGKLDKLNDLIEMFKASRYGEILRETTGAIGNINRVRMTVKDAIEAALKLGFEKTNYLSHGQPVFKRGRMYITPDVDGHIGGVWKAAGSPSELNSKATIWGTFDANLNRIGD